MKLKQAKRLSKAKAKDKSIKRIEKLDKKDVISKLIANSGFRVSVFLLSYSMSRCLFEKINKDPFIPSLKSAAE